MSGLPWTEPCFSLPKRLCFPWHEKHDCYLLVRNLTTVLKKMFKRELLSRNDDQDPLMPTCAITGLQEWARASYHWVISFTGTQRILQKQHVCADGHSIIWHCPHIFCHLVLVQAFLCKAQMGKLNLWLVFFLLVLKCVSQYWMMEGKITASVTSESFAGV